MSPDFIRLKFIDKFGKPKYIEFVLSLYEYFPKRDALFFWQEKLISDLLHELGYHKIDIDKIYEIFNYCPVHDIKLLKDKVPIVDGNSYNVSLNFDVSKESFPLANINAFRDLDRFVYSNSIDVFYCSTCRLTQATKINKL